MNRDPTSPHTWSPIWEGAWRTEAKLSTPSRFMPEAQHRLCTVCGATQRRNIRSKLEKQEREPWAYTGQYASAPYRSHCAMTLVYKVLTE